MGVRFSEFWELTPKDLCIISKGYDKLISEKYEMLWVMGVYNQLAFGSTQSKQVKYPKKPFHKQQQEYLPDGSIAGDVALERMNKLMKAFNQGGGNG